MMNKKAQGFAFGLITFIGIVIILIVLAPTLLHVVTTILTEVGENLNATDTRAGDAVLGIEEDFTNLWDIVIILAFLLNVILLLISAFLVDTHPAFLIFYIIMVFFTVIFVSGAVDALEGIYATSEYQIVVGQYLPMTEFLLDYFEIIILGIAVLSGIITYAKLKGSTRGAY